MLGDGFTSCRISTSGAEIELEHGGSGAPLLLLHGYPQTRMMWHAVAPTLARHFHVICPDLRGYGNSSKPASANDHTPYSKRAMAQDMVEVMTALGYDRFQAAGHDRGARVLHRLALDHPDRLSRVCLMDIVPTYYMSMTVDRHFATGYYHWFFLIQPDGLPERLIGADASYFLKTQLQRWSAPGFRFDPGALADYLRCFNDPATIHASCEDYRAAASIDLEHDQRDRGRHVRCPLLALWGGRGFIQRTYDVLSVWRDYADDVQGTPLDCGHFLAEEQPAAVIEALRAFFR